MALLKGALPPHGKTELRMTLLKQLLELSTDATDAAVEYELAQFQGRGGNQRG